MGVSIAVRAIRINTRSGDALTSGERQSRPAVEICSVHPLMQRDGNSLLEDACRDVCLKLRDSLDELRIQAQQYRGTPKRRWR